MALLLSGGQDSAALAALIRPDLAITIDYGQVCAAAELEAAIEITKALRVPHRVVRTDCSELGSGDLAGRPAASAAPASDWWPFRNQLLITIGATVALSAGLTELAIASVTTDGIHADGRPEFFAAMAALLGQQEGALRLTAPAVSLRTVELIRRSRIPIEVLAWAHSCHTGNLACGTCRGCAKHREVLLELGLDPY